MPKEEIEHGMVSCMAHGTTIEITVHREWLASGTPLGGHSVPFHRVVLDVDGSEFTCRLELDAARLGALVTKLQGALTDLSEGPPRETRKRMLGSDGRR